MPDAAHNRLLDIHRRWIGYVQPVGLLVAPTVLHGVGADANVGADQVRLAEYVTPDTNRVTDIPTFLQAILGWRPEDITPAGDDLSVPLPELGTLLRPTYAVREPAPADGASSWQMLIGVEPDGRDLDAIEEGGRAWAATPQARFERLLRAVEIPVGLLTSGAEFRLIYAPRGESSGHATFRIADMLETAGRPILSAFLMLLHEQRLFGHPDDRLAGLLEESRRYQTEVSAAACEPGARRPLRALARGLRAADLRVGSAQRADLVRRDPDHVYAGLLTVMMRLVFVLYAEDRGLFPDDSVWAQTSWPHNYRESGECRFSPRRGDIAASWNLGYSSPNRSARATHLGNVAHDTSNGDQEGRNVQVSRDQGNHWTMRTTCRVNGHLRLGGWEPLHGSVALELGAIHVAARRPRTRRYHGRHFARRASSFALFVP